MNLNSTIYGTFKLHFSVQKTVRGGLSSGKRQGPEASTKPCRDQHTLKTADTATLSLSHVQRLSQYPPD